MKQILVIILLLSSLSSFGQNVISQKSLATLITKIIESPEKYARQNLGVNKPNS